MPDTIITELPERNMSMRAAVLWAQSYADADSAQMLKTHSGSLDVWKMSIDAGERNEDSTTGTDYQATSEECASSDAIDLSNNASTTVWPGPALLLGIWVEATIGTASITIDDNATSRLAVPVAIPIGVHRLPGVIFETSLVVNPQDSSTGQIRLLYKPLDASVTWAY
jgi:hypothetical protein